MRDLFRFRLGAIILVLRVLVGVAFLVLIERKVLSYLQLRKGPNKLGIIGIVQSFSDAIKLLRKEFFFPLKSNFLIYLFCPVIRLMISLLRWFIIPYWIGLYWFNLSFIFLLVCLRLGVYFLIFSGWSSNSNYAFLGGIRAIIQTISYEIRLIFLLICFLLLVNDFILVKFEEYQKFIWFGWINFPVIFIIFVSMLAEMNRTPFDFSEGERELVSGFNVEYGRVKFTMFFLSEYSRILFIRILLTVFVMGIRINSIIFYFKIIILVFFIILVRGILPRFRFDKLIYLTWKIYLPLSIFLFLFIVSLINYL